LAHILNKGEGSECHPPIQVEGKEKCSYQYYPLFLPQGFFDLDAKNEETGKPFFTYLVQYATQLAPDDQPYSSREIYNHLERHALFGKDASGLASEDAVTPQRSGVCTVALYRLSMRHMLLHSHASPHENHERHKRLLCYKRVVVSEKSQTLLYAYARLQKD